MLAKLKQIWKVKEIRQSLLYVLGILVVVRVAAHIPIPGIDIAGLQNLFSQNQFLGLVNVFSGGGLENFSIMMLGVAPYITASIIFQLLTMIIPRLEEMSKEEMGRQKINLYTRYAAVPLALMQTYGTVTLLRQQAGSGIIPDFTLAQMITIMISVTAGSMFMVWLGELISERHVGNGISFLIFAGIVASIPSAFQEVLLNYDPSQLLNYALFAVVAIVTVAAVVFITEGQRNIPVTYARQVRGGKMYGGTTSHLPLRVNAAGVIPIIFAISIVLFPPLIAQFFLGAQSVWLVTAAQWVIGVFNNQLIYGIIYFCLVVGFTYFYTAVIFHPDQIAENLQRQGGFIPGIRPGQPTALYIGQTMYRIIAAGAVFLGAVAIMPLILQQYIGQGFSAIVGGTSLLIVVSVVIEIMRQIDSQLTMRDYEGL